MVMSFKNKGFSLYIAILFLLPFNLTYAEDENITLVYTGNLDGELEPCGCSEGGNKGGLQRRAQMIDDLKAAYPSLYLVSAGGLITSEVAQDKLKSQYILKGMEKLDYDAVGVQWKDLSYGAELLKNTQLPFVISNTQEDFFHKKIIDRKNHQLAFFSWLDPSRDPQKNASDSIAISNTEPLAKALATAKSKKQLTVLSTTLPLKLAQRKLPLDNVDILLIKAKYERYGSPKKIKNMLVLQPGSRGMRIGKLSFMPNKTGGVLAWGHQIIALPSSVVDAPRMEPWYTAYNAEVKADYEKRVEVLKKLKTKESPFAGEASCQSCHASEHKKWSSTRHADAFYSLKDTNKAFDPNCIGCHTVGFGSPGGFIEPTITKNLMHVQCENCHGAAKTHVTSAGVAPVANKDWSKEKVCGQCHVQKHSPDFNYETYWPKISHGKK